MTVVIFSRRDTDIAEHYLARSLAEKWDAVETDESPQSKDCAVTFKLGDRVLAVATIGRDLENLKVEAEMEAGG